MSHTRAGLPARQAPPGGEQLPLQLHERPQLLGAEPPARVRPAPEHPRTGARRVEQDRACPTNRRRTTVHHGQAHIQAETRKRLPQPSDSATAHVGGHERPCAGHSPREAQRLPSWGRARIDDRSVETITHVVYHCGGCGILHDGRDTPDRRSGFSFLETKHGSPARLTDQMNPRCRPRILARIHALGEHPHGHGRRPVIILDQSTNRGKRPTSEPAAHKPFGMRSPRGKIRLGIQAGIGKDSLPRTLTNGPPKDRIRQSRRLRSCRALDSFHRLIDRCVVGHAGLSYLVQTETEPVKQT